MAPKDRISMTVGFVVFMCIGLWAMLDPNALEGYEALGPRSGLKQLIADFWGVKLGFGMIAFGALALVGLHNQGK